MKFSLLFITCLSMSVLTAAQSVKKVVQLTWGELPQIPDKFGFAGSFAGQSNGALIVAGGANFPDGGAPWTGSKKIWTDKIFVLDSPKSKWKVAGKLPQPIGYGVSVSYGEKLLCIGGSNAEGHLSTVYIISYAGKKIRIESGPQLPQSLANSCGVIIGHKVYIAGGLLTADAKSTANIFWSLDLDKPEAAWQNLDTWPGPARMLSLAGTDGKAFYLFSGADLEEKNGTAHRRYLNDAYKYIPGKGWKTLANLPCAVVAAAGPALNIKGNELLIFGGDDGKLADDAASLKEKHPGFSDRVLSYNIAADTWSQPFKIKTDIKADVATNPNGSVLAPVTTSVVMWRGYLVFPGGEVRPAVRTPRVLTVKVK
jgi:N-acetylneuraminic acid mutarotase